MHGCQSSSEMQVRDVRRVSRHRRSEGRLRVTKGFERMIDALKSDDIVRKMGGRFKLTALIQRRMKEIVVDGARPLIERQGRTDLELVMEEIIQGKIAPDFSESGWVKPKKPR
jgi:DNA-directed RNA polymerase subunit omega